jgi:DnaJ-class molecular chaperone
MRIMNQQQTAVPGDTIRDEKTGQVWEAVPCRTCFGEGTVHYGYTITMICHKCGGTKVEWDIFIHKSEET